MEARKMSKNRAIKYDIVKNVMDGIDNWENASTPGALAVDIEKEAGVKMSGMTVYLIIMEMVEAGYVARNKFGRKWRYALASAGDINNQIGMEPDDPECDKIAAEMEAKATDVVPFDVE